ncbi:MAG: NAD(+)/NADH kinase, partial [Bacteroidota bacterium]
MKVAIYSRGTDDEMALQLPGLMEALNKYKIDIVLLQNLPVNGHLLAQNIPYFENTKELDSSIDFLISLGGDGTMLDAVTLVNNKNIPILGINFGRLGFLAGIGKDDLASAVD